MHLSKGSASRLLFCSDTKDMGGMAISGVVLDGVASVVMNFAPRKLPKLMQRKNLIQDNGR
jgi:hypothetical protein